MTTIEQTLARTNPRLPKTIGKPERKVIDATVKALSGRRRFEGHARPVSKDGLKHMLLAYRADKHGAVVPDFKFQPGMLYTSVRAISARINQNWDAWPSVELKKSYKTFLGKPCFVNHNNFDPDLARGRVVAARYVENGRDKYIEVIQEIDAQRFPKLAHEIRTGGMDSVSMGVEAGFTICSYCGNKASDVWEMCDHVKFHKGSHLPDPKTGEPKLVYENCYKLGFFELSYVFDPADETAVVSRVIAAGRHEGLNEDEAPEDIDTLRTDDGDSADDYEFVEPYHSQDEENPFHGAETIEELMAPDLDQTKRLDRAQEEQGLDSDRRVEDVTGVGAPEAQEQGPPPARAATRRKEMARTRSRRVAAEEDEDRRPPPWLQDDGDDQGDDSGPPPADDDSDDDTEDYGGDDQDDEGPDDSGEDSGGDDADSEDDLIDEAERDLEQARQARRRRPKTQPRQASRRRTAEDDKDDDDSDDDDDKDDDDSDDKPPWLKEKESRRRSPVRGRSSQKKGRKKGAAVGAPSLSSRGRVASQGRRQHFADDNGYTDGGPYGRNEQPQPEEQINSVFGEGDGVPEAEPVEAPAGDESKVNNSESALVARIQAKRQSLQADLVAWQRLQARRHQAEDVKDPTVVNPELSATDDQSIKGDDFQDTGLEDTTTHPTDGDSNNKIGQSRQLFRAFDQWLTQVTGRPWQQHTAGSLTRHAARWCQGARVSPNSLYPTLDIALRQARKGEAQRRANMNRYAEDQALETAAPDERVDPTKPVSNETDERAQSSQFDLGDYGHNAGDDLAKPEMSSDSQIWAPGEGRAATRHKMADGVTAVRCAEAYIKANLARPADKWKLAAWLQTIRHATVVDRTNLLEAVCEVNQRAFTAARVPAGRLRGASTIPPGFGSGRVATTQRIADNDPINDSVLFL